MRGLDGKRYLDRHFKRPTRDFAALYPLFKRCFPISDHQLSRMLAVDGSHFCAWKGKRRNPCYASLQLIIILCLWRIGRVKCIWDLTLAGTVDNLDEMIAEWEAEQKAKAAKECAKTGQLPSQKVSKPRKPRKH